MVSSGIPGPAPGIRPKYDSTRSPHAPQYRISPNFHGINKGRLLRFGKSSAMFAATLGVGGLFFTADIPRFREDIMKKIPGVAWYYNRDVPPEDNPF